MLSTGYLKSLLDITLCCLLGTWNHFLVSLCAVYWVLEINSWYHSVVYWVLEINSWYHSVGYLKSLLDITLCSLLGTWNHFLVSLCTVCLFSSLTVFCFFGSEMDHLPRALCKYILFCRRCHTEANDEHTYSLVYISVPSFNQSMGMTVVGTAATCRYRQMWAQQNSMWAQCHSEIWAQWTDSPVKKWDWLNADMCSNT